MFKRLLSLSAGAMLMVGCAHSPDVDIEYNLAKTDVRFKVIRTVSCDKNDNPVVVNAVTPTIRHSADKNQRHQVPLAKLKGNFSDADAKFTFYEDGRLKEFNAVSTGQGEPILKTVVSIAGVFAFDGNGETFPDACKLIAKAGGEKPITLTYEGPLRTDVKDMQYIEPDATSTVYANNEKIVAAIGRICAVVEETDAGIMPLTPLVKGQGASLKARQPGSAKIALSSSRADDCKGGVIWHDDVRVAQLGTMYHLPIPAPAAFGKQTFSASFAESGALSSVQYASNTAAVPALNGAQTVLTALQGDSAAQKAAEIKAEADLIAQQQRLVACLATPATCK